MAKPPEKGKTVRNKKTAAPSQRKTIRLSPANAIANANASASAISDADADANVEPTVPIWDIPVNGKFPRCPRSYHRKNKKCTPIDEKTKALNERRTKKNKAGPLVNLPPCPDGTRRNDSGQCTPLTESQRKNNENRSSLTRTVKDTGTEEKPDSEEVPLPTLEPKPTSWEDLPVDPVTNVQTQVVQAASSLVELDKAPPALFPTPAPRLEPFTPYTQPPPVETQPEVQEEEGQRMEEVVISPIPDEKRLVSTTNVSTDEAESNIVQEENVELFNAPSGTKTHQEPELPGLETGSPVIEEPPVALPTVSSTTFATEEAREFFEGNPRLYALQEEKKEYDAHASDAVNDGYPTVNDAQFQEKIAKKKEFFHQQYDPRVYDIAQRADELCHAEFELTPHQLFVKNFLSPETPYNSLLLYHGLGTGKTCTAIGVAESYRQYMKQTGQIRKIMVVANSNVLQNFRRQLFDDTKVTDHMHSFPVGCAGSHLLEEINPFMKWESMTRDKVIAMVSKVIDKYYEFVGYTKLARMIYRLIQDKVSIDNKMTPAAVASLQQFFDDRLVIVDEVHNIRQTKNSVVTSALEEGVEEEESVSNDSLQEKKKQADMGKIGELMTLVATHARNMRLLLLTATPIFDYFEEIIWLTNLMNLNDKRPKLRVEDVFYTKPNGDNKRGDFLPSRTLANGVVLESGRDLLQRKLTGYISYVRSENPYAFPFRVYPDVFSPERTLGGSLFPKPTQQFDGQNITESLRYVKVYGSPMSSIQQATYRHIVNAYRQQTREKMILNYLVQSCNMVYGSVTSDNPNLLQVRSTFGDGGFQSVIKRVGNKKQYAYQDIRTPRVFSPTLLPLYSCKIASIIESIRQSTGIVLVYSQYLEIGVVSVALALEEAGFIKYTGGGDERGGNRQGSLFSNGLQVAKLDATQHPLAPLEGNGLPLFPANYMMITGDSELSPQTAAHLARATAPDNKDGKFIKVILISDAGSEGIDFKNIRQVHVLEPWYNMNKIEQVIGRAVRNKSHCDLPFVERNVEIFLHVCILDNNSVTNIVPNETEKTVVGGMATPALNNPTIAPPPLSSAPLPQNPTGEYVAPLPEPTTQEYAAPEPTTQEYAAPEPTTQEPLLQNPTGDYVAPEPTTQEYAAPEPTTQEPLLQNPTGDYIAPLPEPTTQEPLPQNPTGDYVAPQEGLNESGTSSWETIATNMSSEQASNAPTEGSNESGTSSWETVATNMSSEQVSTPEPSNMSSEQVSTPEPPNMSSEQVSTPETVGNTLLETVGNTVKSIAKTVVDTVAQITSGPPTPPVSAFPQEPENTITDVAPVVEPDVAPIVEPDVAPIVEPDVAPVVEPDVAPIVEPDVAPVVGPVEQVVPVPVPSTQLANTVVASSQVSSQVSEAPLLQVSPGMETEEAIDLYVYRKYAESKAILNGKITRLMKEVSVDCLLNVGQMNMTVEKLQSLDANKNIQIHLSSTLDSNELTSFQVGDRPFTDMCDYMESCAYTTKTIPAENQVVAGTYNSFNVRQAVSFLLPRVKTLFRENTFLTRQELFAQLNQERPIPVEQIYATLSTLVNDPSQYVIDAQGRVGRVVNFESSYFFQPADLQDTHASLLERSIPVDLRQSSRMILIPPKVAPTALKPTATTTLLKSTVDVPLTTNLYTERWSMVLQYIQNPQALWDDLVGDGVSEFLKEHDVEMKIWCNDFKSLFSVFRAMEQLTLPGAKELTEVERHLFVFQHFVDTLPLEDRVYLLKASVEPGVDFHIKNYFESRRIYYGEDDESVYHLYDAIQNKVVYYRWGYEGRKQVWQVVGDTYKTVSDFLQEKTPLQQQRLQPLFGFLWRNKQRTAWTFKLKQKFVPGMSGYNSTEGAVCQTGFKKLMGNVAPSELHPLLQAVATLDETLQKRQSLTLPKLCVLTEIVMRYLNDTDTEHISFLSCEWYRTLIGKI